MRSRHCTTRANLRYTIVGFGGEEDEAGEVARLIKAYQRNRLRGRSRALVILAGRFAQCRAIADRFEGDEGLLHRSPHSEKDSDAAPGLRLRMEAAWTSW
jgi:hypothetical protein